MKNLLILIFMLFISYHMPIAYAVNKNTSNHPVKSEQIQITVVHTDKVNSIRGKSALRLKEMLEIKFPNQVKVIVSDNNSFYKEGEELEALDLGIINITINPHNQIAKTYELNELQLFNLPFLFYSDQEVKKIIKGDTGNLLTEKLNQKLQTTQVIGYWLEGQRIFAGHTEYNNITKFNRKIVATTAPYNNQVFYTTMNSKIISTIIDKNNKNFLFNNTSKVDVADISILQYNDLLLKDNFKIITETDHAYNVGVVLTNKKWLNSLPTEIKNGLLEIVQSTLDYSSEVGIKNKEEIKSNLKKSGVKIIPFSKIDKDNFKKDVLPVYNKYSQSNKQIIVSAENEIKNQNKGK